MRAVVTTDYGSPPEVAELDLPEPAEGEVRVRVHAASVNGFDLAVAAGYLKDMMEHRFPVVLGKDFAGTVDAVGAGVNGYAPGDRVFGVVTKSYLGDGSFAEYATVATAVGLAKLPDSIAFAEAARSASPARPRSPPSTRRASPPDRRCSSRARPAASATRSSSSPSTPVRT